MLEPTTRYMKFFGAAVLLFILTVDGFDVLARVQVAREPLPSAIYNTAHYSLVQPIGTLLTFLPFLFVAWICGSLARVNGSRAIGLMAACSVVFALLHYSGHMKSQGFMLIHMWTAATLAVALIPFKSIPVVLVALVLRFLLGRGYASTVRRSGQA